MTSNDKSTTNTVAVFRIHSSARSTAGIGGRGSAFGRSALRGSKSRQLNSRFSFTLTTGGPAGAFARTGFVLGVSTFGACTGVFAGSGLRFVVFRAAAFGGRPWSNSKGSRSVLSAFFRVRGLAGAAVASLGLDTRGLAGFFAAALGLGAVPLPSGRLRGRPPPDAAGLMQRTQGGMQ
jgi:hypothetical protein